jgi:hypothetical protein
MSDQDNPDIPIGRAFLADANISDTMPTTDTVDIYDDSDDSDDSDNPYYSYYSDILIDEKPYDETGHFIPYYDAPLIGYITE